MKQRLALILAGLFCLTSLVACQSAPTMSSPTASITSTEAAPQVNKDQVTIAFSSEPHAFDPIKGYNAAGAQLFSTLVTRNAKDEVIPELATDWVISEDGLVYTFHLRDDVKFTDGTPLTSEDIRFTYEKIKAEPSEIDLSMVKTVEAPDAKTLVLTLDKRNITLLFGLSEVGIVSKNAYGEGYGDHPVTSGPYKLAQWDKGQQYIFEANEVYYGEAPHIPRVIFLIKAEDAREAAVRAGEVDVALTSAPLAQANMPGYTLVAMQTADNRGITWPCIPNEGKTTEEGYPIGNHVSSDLAIRRAISYAIDREAIATHALNRYATPAYSECDGFPWWNPETVIQTNVEQAQKWLDEAGWVMGQNGVRVKNGLEARMNLMYFAGDSLRQAVALSVAQQLEENLGILLHVEGVSEDETQKRMFSDPMIMGWGSSNPMTSYLLFHSSNAGRDDWYNPENFRNATVDQYMDEAMASPSMQASIPFWQKAQWDGKTGTSMRGESPWTFLINIDHLYYVRPGLSLGDQAIHAHGASWTLIQNLKDWKWN